MMKQNKSGKRYTSWQFLQLPVSKFILLFTSIQMIVHIGSAVPNIPMIVSGNVYINGAPAPAGTVVKTTTGGELKGSTILTQTGTYGLVVNYTQGSVQFYINNAKAQSINWSSNPQILDLSVTISRPISSSKATNSTMPEARVTDTVIPGTKNATQGINTQQEEISRRTVQSPGLESFVVVFAVVLISKLISRRKK